MPICDKHRFVFLHVPKTGGVSVTMALRRAGLALTFDRGVSVWPRLEGHPRGADLVRRLKAMYPLNTVSGFCEPHLPASVLFELAEPQAREYFTFAFVRNPWELVVSTYHYWVKVFAEQAELGRLDPDFPPLLAGDFAAFVRRYPMVAADQTAFVSDEHGRSVVDFVGRCERLADDFATVCSRIGVAAKLQQENTTKHGPYREYYTDETRAIIECHFARDIAAFGYRF
jgi:hypothetical protein